MIGILRLSTIHTAKGYVRKGFGHAISAPHFTGESAQLGFEFRIQGSTANNEAKGAAQQRTIVGMLQTFIHLHGGESGKVGSFVQTAIGTRGGGNSYDLQLGGKGAHQHHLRCNESEGHT